MTIPVFITLGSNVEPEKHLPEAVRLLSDQFTLHAASRVYRTVPLDASGQVSSQPPFLNAAVLINLETGFPPAALKYEVLRPLETRLGRARTADKFAPRTIDLDIALYSDLILDDPQARITIPDPDILTRAHVALPLADLAPGFAHPVTGQTLADIAARFANQPGISLYPLSLTP